jgi:hypothetical protein
MRARIFEKLLYQSKNFSHIRGDSIIALSIPLLAIGVLTEAYFRTDLGDAQSAEACEYAASEHTIDSSHILELEENGIVVIPNALNPEMLDNARRDIHKFQANTSSQGDSGFANSGLTDDIRQDQVAWLRIPQLKNRTTERKGEKVNVKTLVDEGAPFVGDSLVHCIRLVRGVAHVLENSSYTGSFFHRVPRQCQLAMYRGDSKSGYKRHLDRCNSSIYDLGLLEWLRLSDYRGRAVTAILYLNDPKRTVQEGGALRCWQPDSLQSNDSLERDERENKELNPSWDIQPTGGSLVIFDSNRIDHMVLPSTTDRYALTCWVNGVLEDK